MIKSIRRRFILLAVLTLLAIFSCLPSLISNLPGGLQKILSSEGLRLRLDLQGGMNLILKVNLPQAVQSQLEQSLTDLRATLKEKKIAVGQAGADLPALIDQALATGRLKKNFSHHELNRAL